MKRITIFLISVLLMLSVTLTAFAENPQKVVDNADLFTEQEEINLTEELTSIYNNDNFDVAIVTVTDTEGKTDEEYADDYYDYNGYGYGENGDGCLLLIRVLPDGTKKIKYIHLSTKGYGIYAITDYGREHIFDEIESDLINGDYYTACVDFISYVQEFIDDANEGKPFDVQEDSKKNTIASIGVSFIIALVIALIITFGVKSKYKPVKFNRGASNYLVDGSLNMKSSYDNFLYSSVSRTKIETESSSSSHGGSSTHTSSSGSTHGGGGRSF